MSSAAKKFGTFAGVYTPSVLTILGVIMYLRMGMVVGNAGLGSTIAIILVAHIISVTTGLAVSTIATDKKIEAGGIYYMLSRSLGLPIGGAIGYTLFIGTALAIALYLVGFSESFIEVFAVDGSISWLGGLDPGLYITIIATAALILITVVAFISTSIALKAQFFILGAIVLSLVSIFLGVYPSAEDLNISEDLVKESRLNDWFGVFAIFFPAVTGFTAGVAMSGDLADPKKSIPTGTILSIATGLIIYLVLAIFIAFAIPEDLLITDNNALKRYSYWPFLVVAGIWGATLSSAIGSLLGAPRILQAMSNDKISPRIFGIGVGPENEPRNALLLTFVIAQAGILIGSLNTIAEVVSMFYLSAYGFINLAQFLESWASSDFLPTFRIPKWIGLLGFSATIIVMLKLNALAMFVAIIVILIIFLLLARKQIALGSGDVWQSVWSSVVKSGLKRMDRQEMHKRNWEPNILLFSGGSNKRPHLIDFSKDLAGRLGMISNFDLVEVDNEEALFPKHQKSSADKELQQQGVFSRRQECSNVFKGIEMIASTYGFSGIEPNTVLMGWARDTKDPVWFAEMNKRLHQMDYNVLYLDYDDKKGLGKQEKIDIWWDGFGNDCEFTLSLVKLLQTSNNWRNADVRVLMVNNQNEQKLTIEDRIQELTDDLRVNAKIKVINNAIDQKSFYDIVKLESFDADLVILSIPTVLDGKENEFVRATTDLVGTIGTTLLLKASSSFDDIGLDLEKIDLFNSDNISSDPFAIEYNVVLGKGISPELNRAIIDLDTQLSKFNLAFSSKASLGIEGVYKGKSKYISLKIKELLGDNSLSKTALRKEVAVLFNEVTEDVSETQLHPAAKSIALGIQEIIAAQKQLIDNSPTVICRLLSNEEITANETDDSGTKSAKRGKRFAKKLGANPKVNVKFNKLVSERYATKFLPAFNLNLNVFGDEGYSALIELKKLYEFIDKGIEKSEDINSRQLSVFIDDEFSKFNSRLEQSRAKVLTKNNDLTRKFCNTIILDTARLDVNSKRETRQEDQSARKIKSNYSDIGTYPERWLQNQKLLHNNLKLDLLLNALKSDLDGIIENKKSKFEDRFINQTHIDATRFVNHSSEIKKQVEQRELDLDKFNAINISFDGTADYAEVLKELIDEIELSIAHFPEELELIDTDIEESDVDFIAKGKTSIRLKKLIEYVLEAQLVEDIEDNVELIDKELNKVQIQNENSEKLLRYSLNNADLNDVQRKEVANKCFEDASSSLAKVENLKEKLERSLRGDKEKVFEILNSGVLVSRADKYNKYISKESSKKGLALKWNRLKERFNTGYKNVAIKISKQKQKLQSKQFDIANESNRNIHEVFRDFSDSVSCSKEVGQQLPFYYKQLFTEIHFSNDQKIRSREMEFLQLALQRLEGGSDGAILLTGEPLSGYNALIGNVGKFTNEKKVIQIDIKRSDKNDLSSLLYQATGFKGTLAKQLERLPINTTVCFRNIELLFLKGSSNIEFNLLLKMVKKFSDSIKIVLSCNIHFYQQVREFTALEDCLISTIQMMPLTFEELKSDLLARHHSGGIDFSLDGKMENFLKEREINKLMKRFHTISHGNSGVAAKLWLASISRFKDETVFLETLLTPDIPALNDSLWLLVLNEIILHKKLSTPDIVAMFNQISSDKMITIIQSLKRTHLVIENDNGMLQINVFVSHFVLQELKEKQLLN